jgi:hypothetical protein
LESRRHRINSGEVPAVAAGLHAMLCLYTEGVTVPLSVQAAFRAYYRITNYRKQGGKPDYPNPITRETILKTLKENESFSLELRKIGTIIGNGTVNTPPRVPAQEQAPNLISPGLVTLKEAA